MCFQIQVLIVPRHFADRLLKPAVCFRITGVSYREGKFALAGYRVYVKPAFSVGLDVQVLDCLTRIYWQPRALGTWTVHHLLSPERCNMYEYACVTAGSETVQQKPALPLGPAGRKGMARALCMNSEEPATNRHALN